MQAVEDLVYPSLGISQSAKGIGYGLLIGCMKDFGKYFGIEPGLYTYYLLTDSGNKFEGVGSAVYQKLTSGYHMGM